MKPWHVSDPNGQIHIELLPRYDNHSKIDLKATSRETHQVFGTWSGTITDDHGARFELNRIQGFAEESCARW